MPASAKMFATVACPTEIARPVRKKSLILV